ncbi:MAG: hypothetical protein HY862_00175 [Chloroflexi bacterium]|nr:hypothetical protein [Chloroflexota bacterium]
MSEPFRSRPRVTRPASKPPATQPPQPPEEDIIEGVIEEERGVVPFDPVVSQQEQQRAQYYEYLAREEDHTKTGLLSKIASPGLFLVALALVGGGVFFTLLNVVNLPTIITHWWPIITLFVSLFWSLSALNRRNAAAFLGGAGAVGLSLSLLLHAQEIANFGETFVGIVLISIGTGVIMRGLLLRQATA